MFSAYSQIIKSLCIHHQLLYLLIFYRSCPALTRHWWMIQGVIESERISWWFRDLNVFSLIVESLTRKLVSSIASRSRHLLTHGSSWRTARSMHKERLLVIILAHNFLKIGHWCWWFTVVLRVEYGTVGRLLNNLLVRVSSPIKSVLHSCFHWNWSRLIGSRELMYWLDWCQDWCQFWLLKSLEWVALLGEGLRVTHVDIDRWKPRYKRIWISRPKEWIVSLWSNGNRSVLLKCRKSIVIVCRLCW